MTPPGGWIAIPKPSLVTGWVAARLHAPRISEAVATRVVAQYGSQLVGHPANLSQTWRNHVVVIRTSAGRKVLKEYRETSNLETIAHEHSIIDHLEACDFPSTRLDHTPEGSSVVEVDGRLYASFDFESGRNLTATFRSGAGRRELVARAGRTLALLHHDLRDFQPAGSHHLGADADSGDRDRDLAWHLAALDRLRNEPLASGSEVAASDIRYLQQQADALSQHLVESAGHVQDANLPTLLIHGDYGTHNLLFRRDGTAVVHDFELARHDWRLLDIVIASLRLTPAQRGSFIAGYREEGDLPDRELDLLPWLWRYHLLSGAVRSWHVYSELGGEGRLATARTRLVRADSGPAEALAR
jgi:Ser/Thr protein kinase RdoA (MazF antagonist)